MYEACQSRCAYPPSDAAPLKQGGIVRLGSIDEVPTRRLVLVANISTGLDIGGLGR